MQRTNPVEPTLSSWTQQETGTTDGSQSAQLAYTLLHNRRAIDSLKSGGLAVSKSGPELEPDSKRFDTYLLLNCDTKRGGAAVSVSLQARKLKLPPGRRYHTGRHSPPISSVWNMLPTVLRRVQQVG